MAGTAEIIATGVYFGEGPRWRNGRLWFSDFFARTVYSMGDDHKLVPECVLPDDQPSGLGWLPDGRLLVVSMVQRKVLRREADGTLAVHADLSQLAEFHCNDMVVDAQGRAYVGNFGFDLEHAVETETIAELLHEKTATLVRVDPDGSVHAAATGLKFPNGTVITPDGSTLIVAETLGQTLTAFRVDADGSLHDRRVWADLGGRAPDGICLDADGDIWVANPLAPECFLVAEDGGVVDVIDTGDPCFACTLGGTDGRTLYMLTAPSSRAGRAAAAPKGAVRVARVDTAGAGSP
jgi:sugar lactone lactonase YvrE